MHDTLVPIMMIRPILGTAGDHHHHHHDHAWMIHAYVVWSVTVDVGDSGRVLVDSQIVTLWRCGFSSRFSVISVRYPSSSTWNFLGT